ncbi:MAG: polysaccharide biosynthesis tyrosine autokinase [Fimbriimonadaceae bacterium]
MTTAERETQNWQQNEYSSSVTVTEFLNSIKRNKGVFWTTLLACLALGVIASLLLPEKFGAGSEVLVEGTAPGGVNTSPGNIIGELDIAGAAYPLSTQVELLQSQDVFWQALEKAGIAIPTTLKQLNSLPKVSVRQKKESNIFIVVVEGTKKKEVQALAVAYPEVFKEYANRLRDDAAQRAQEFVSNRLKEENAALKQVEAEYTNFKSSNQIVDSGAEVSTRLELVSTAEQQLAEARATESAASAATEQARQDLNSTSKVRTRLNDERNTLVLLDNKQQLNNLQIQRAQLSETYLPASRIVKELDNQIAEKQKFITELEKTLKPVVNDDNPEYDVAKRRYSDSIANVNAASSRRQQLEQLMAARQSRLNALGTLTRDQREFERRIALHTQTISGMTDLFQRVSLRNNSIKSPTQTLTRAVYAEQTQPNWLVNMAIASIVGLALAIVFSLVRDSSQDRVNSREEAFLLSGLSPLANIPERSRSKHPVITNPQSNMAFESYRVLRSNIAVYARDNKMKSLTVTSTLRKEGKSVVASNLAIAYVLAGQRTILVDANMRYPSLHTLFGCADKPGLGDLLLGTAIVNDVLQSTTVEGLYVVTAGTIPANATEVMGSPRMQEIINMLGEQADILVIDAPQVAGLADAPSIAAVTDASILVSQIGKSSKGEFKEAVGILEASSPALLGVVFNRVSAKEAHLTKV